MKAAGQNDPAINRILADATQLPAEIIEAARPRWSGYPLDGMPNVDSVMEQGAFWAKAGLIPKAPTAAETFDLGIAEEARKRLDDKNPFV